METEVSIIIPTKDNMDLLKQCLQVLEENTKGIEYEIVLADNGSKQTGLAEYYKSLIPDKYFVVNCSDKANFAKLCNEGAAVSRGRYLCFLNNDVFVGNGWLNELLKMHKEKSKSMKVGCVGAKLLFPDKETIQHIGQMVRNFDNVPTHLYYGRKINDPAVVDALNRERKVIGVTAACMLVSREAFDKVKGFDEVYQNGVEDVDFCFKLKENGYTHFYCPKSESVHIEHGTGRNTPNIDQGNIQLFFRKWINKLRRVDIL